MNDQPIIEVPADDILDTLGHGSKWIKGVWRDGDGNMCLHQAIRVCHPQPGDAYLIEQVANAQGWGIDFNDAAGTDFMMVEQSIRLHKEGVHDWELEETFGPQWAEIVALVRRASVLTADDAAAAAAAAVRADAAAAAAAAMRAYTAAVRAYAAATAAHTAAVRADAAATAATDAAYAVYATGRCALALSVRHLIDQHGFTQDRYDTLTGPWRTAIGAVHPDDQALTT